LIDDRIKEVRKEHAVLTGIPISVWPWSSWNIAKFDVEHQLIN
jgi:hypothetical protein